MQPRSFAIMLFACALAACNSHEGHYAPACVAYAGDKITLSDGLFVWEKFTDALIVDADGNLVNQFPGYPMHGTYRVNGDTVVLEPDSGEALENMHLQKRDDIHYLLTAGQFAEWKSSGEFAECALILGGNRRD